MSITPVFLLSLPRSGSTLAQRVIAAHDRVSTSAEPWLLLALLGPVQRPNTMEDPWQRSVALAIEDFLAELPGGEEEYLEEIRRLTTRLYERVAEPGSSHFLDKTPHYYLVVDVILRAFPDAKFVFLWRNPLSIISSLTESFGEGRWRMARYRLQLFHGVHNYVCAFDRNRDRVFGVRYEDLVTNEQAWRPMMDYIGVPFESAALTRFVDVTLGGRMKDPTGIRAYRTIDSEPLEKWRRTINNPIRVAWCKRYLRWLGHDRLNTMGYDLDALLASIETVSVGSAGVMEDSLELAHSAGRELWRARMPGNRLISSSRALLGSRRRT